MSTAFIYGGIDRDDTAWTARDTEATTRQSASSVVPQQAGDASSVSYTYGGIDRQPVNWVSPSKR